MANKATTAQWLLENKIKYVELMVSDMAGIPRGKVLPVEEFGEKKKKMPLSILGQTITGDYHFSEHNIKDGDMEIRPDYSTAAIVPWATEPTASFLVDCYELAGNEIEYAPRAVLKRIVKKYNEKGWHPVVAPEVEFYLVVSQEDRTGDVNAFDPRDDESDKLVDAYGFDFVHELGEFFEQLSDCCEKQGIAIGAVSQELGPSQFEVNFPHGSPLALADDVFQFKRAIKSVASGYGIHASFIAKPSPEYAGSALHVHQSVYDGEKNNIFSDKDGAASEYFYQYIGGLQAYTRDSLLMMAPYANSYRRFLSYLSSPVNLEWGIDNRTAGFRAPESDPMARRVENRLAGSDANPYLAIAATLACGYLGLVNKKAAKPAVQDSAYDVPFALHRHQYEAIDALRNNVELNQIFGEEFVTIFSAVKEMEQREFQARVTEWERESLIYSL